MNTKSLISLIVGLLLPVCAVAQTFTEEVTIIDLKYRLFSDGTATVARQPSSLSGTISVFDDFLYHGTTYRVVAVDDEAFRGTAINYINFSCSLPRIGARAFADCSQLTSVVLPQGLKSIGDMCFYNCPQLTVFVCNNTVPPTLGSSVFRGNDDMFVYVPDGVEQDYADASGWGDFEIGYIGGPQEGKTKPYASRNKSRSVSAESIAVEAEPVEEAVPVTAAKPKSRSRGGSLSDYASTSRTRERSSERRAAAAEATPVEPVEPQAPSPDDDVTGQTVEDEFKGTLADEVTSKKLNETREWLDRSNVDNTLLYSFCAITQHEFRKFTSASEHSALLREMAWAKKTMSKLLSDHGKSRLAGDIYAQFVFVDNLVESFDQEWELSGGSTVEMSISATMVGDAARLKTLVALAAIYEGINSKQQRTLFSKEACSMLAFTCALGQFNCDLGSYPAWGGTASATITASNYTATFSCPVDMLTGELLNPSKGEGSAATVDTNVAKLKRTMTAAITTYTKQGRDYFSYDPEEYTTYKNALAETKGMIPGVNTALDSFIKCRRARVNAQIEAGTKTAQWRSASEARLAKFISSMNAAISVD